MSSNNMDRYVVYFPIRRDAATEPFSVPENADVETLANAIYAHPNFKHHLEGEALYLYRCENLSKAPATRYDNALQWIRDHPGSKMDGDDRLRHHFPTGPAPEEARTIDVLAVNDTITESPDVLYALADLRISKTTKDRFSQLDKIANFPYPSEGVNSEDQIKTWMNEKSVIHPHCPAGNYGPHTALFHPALARLKDRLTHLDQVEEPSADHLEWAHKFLLVCINGCKKEKLWEGALKEIVNNLIGEDALWQASLPNKSAKPDARWGDIVRMILELKNTDGLGGSATLQAMLVYAKILEIPKHRSYITRSNCPVVLIGLMGSRLEISTAIFTNGIYTDKLFSEDLCVDAWQSETVLRVGRIFKALSLVNVELRDFYESIAYNQEPGIDHQFPNPLPREGFVVPHLDYLGKLSRGGTLLDESDEEEVHRERPYALYRATMTRTDNGEEVNVVVKFTVRYHEGAHRILAKKQLAPELHFCIPLVGDMVMVIMDYVDGKSLYFCKKEPKGYDKIYSDVEAAVKLLHGHDLVFGDLRDANIILKPGGGAMLIDFDWVGKHQTDRYPASWNNQADRWAPSVGRRVVMEKIHDIFMLEKLKNRWL